MPFGEVGKGNYAPSTSLLARPAVTERMLENMFIGDPPSNTDRILEFSTALTGSLFFTPIVDFLNNPAVTAGRDGDRSPEDDPFRRLTGNRQPERTAPMNNLYRELAPVTESAAWEQSN